MLNKFTPSKHQHKHYFSSVKTEFEQMDPKLHGDDVYKRVDYAYLMCNSPCNHVKKVKVEKGSDSSQD